MEKDYILLKWGTLKGYDLSNNWDRPEVQEAIERYNNSGTHNMSAMLQNDNDAQKKALCDLIDVVKNCTFQNDWDGKKYNKKQAKEYIMAYTHDIW